MQSRECNDQLSRVAERGIQQSADAFACMMGDVFGGMSEPTRERHNGKTRGDEYIRVCLRPEELKPDRDRYKDEQPIEH